MSEYAYNNHRSGIYGLSKAIQAKAIFEWVKRLNVSGRALEIGPGHGELLPYWERMFFRPKVQDIRKSEYYTVDYCQRLPLVADIKGGWGFIFMSHVLEHLDVPWEVLQTFENMNQSTGQYLVIIVPDYLRWGRDFWDVDITHGVPFTMRRIEQLAQRFGYKIVRRTVVTGPFVGPMAALVSWVYRWCGIKWLFNINARLRRAGYSLNGDIMVAMEKE